MAPDLYRLASRLARRSGPYPCRPVWALRPAGVPPGLERGLDGGAGLA